VREGGRERERERDCHCRIKILPYTDTTPNQKNVSHPASVDNTKIHIPPVYIEFSLIKISVKMKDKESERSAYLRQKFPKMREAKMKNIIFIGPRIKQPLKENQNFILLN
jgi:hypothetical protein